MNRNIVSTSIFLLRNTWVRSIHTTTINYALPTKAKKKADPTSDKIREDRKRRRYEKAISKLEKFKLQLKPIHEYESERRILKELDVRKRSPSELTSEETTQRLMLNRDWAKHKHKQHQQEINLISRALKSQENALEQLKQESEQLYEQAIQVDTKLIPYIRRGPLYSLPNPSYDAPDGDYFDTTNYFSKGFGVNFMDHMKTMERQKWTEIRAERRAKKEEKDADK
ncbi:hypothetical protein I4U23_024028 [Adineta vaga]|nr:hypothetical protein I4U23_024028 [Adineta vaga]